MLSAHLMVFLASASRCFSRLSFDVLLVISNVEYLAHKETEKTAVYLFILMHCSRGRLDLASIICFSRDRNTCGNRMDI